MNDWANKFMVVEEQQSESVSYHIFSLAVNRGKNTTIVPMIANYRDGY